MQGMPQQQGMQGMPMQQGMGQQQIGMVQQQMGQPQQMQPMNQQQQLMAQQQQMMPQQMPQQQIGMVQQQQMNQQQPQGGPHFPAQAQQNSPIPQQQMGMVQQQMGQPQQMQMNQQQQQQLQQQLLQQQLQQQQQQQQQQVNSGFSKSSPRFIRQRLIRIRFNVHFEKIIDDFLITAAATATAQFSFVVPNWAGNSSGTRLESAGMSPVAQEPATTQRLKSECLTGGWQKEQTGRTTQNRQIAVQTLTYRLHQVQRKQPGIRQLPSWNDDPQSVEFGRLEVHRKEKLGSVSRSSGGAQGTLRPDPC